MSTPKKVSTLVEGDVILAGDGTPWLKCLEKVRSYGDGSFACNVQNLLTDEIGMHEWSEEDNNPTVDTTFETPPPTPATERAREEDNLAEQLSRPIDAECSNCHEGISSTWNFCPFCAHDLRDWVDIVFEEVLSDENPPQYIFIEAEDKDGKSVKFGEWVRNVDPEQKSYIALRIHKDRS